MCFDKLNTNRPNSLNQKVFVFAFLINSFFVLAQIEAPNNFDGELLFKFETDSIPQAGIRLEEVVLFQPLTFRSIKELRQYVILRNRTLRVYPYAKLASDRLDTLSIRLKNIKRNRKKKTYIKRIENFIYDEFVFDQPDKLISNLPFVSGTTVDDDRNIIFRLNVEQLFDYDDQAA